MFGFNHLLLLAFGDFLGAFFGCFWCSLAEVWALASLAQCVGFWAWPSFFWYSFATVVISVLYSIYLQLIFKKKKTFGEKFFFYFVFGISKNS